MDLLPAAAEVEAAGQIHPHAAARVQRDWADLGRGGCTRAGEINPAVLADLFAISKVNSHKENSSAGVKVQPAI